MDIHYVVYSMSTIIIKHFLMFLIYQSLDLYGHMVFKFGAQLSPRIFDLVKPFRYASSNAALHDDLKIQTVNELARSHYKTFHSKLTDRKNPSHQEHVLCHLSPSLKKKSV